jgi:hypothetical protein
LWTILRLKKLEASFDQRWWFIAPFIVHLSAQHSCFLISGHVSLLFVLRAINQSVFFLDFAQNLWKNLKIRGDRWPTLLNVTTFVIRHSMHSSYSYFFGFCIVSVLLIEKVNLSLFNYF